MQYTKRDKQQIHLGAPDLPQRRNALKAGLAGAGVALAGVGAIPGGAHAADTNPYADPVKPALPPSDMKLDLKRTALVVTDPQIDFLSPDGVT